MKRCLLRWWTRRRHAVAARHLDGLVAELKPTGWRFVQLYRIEGFTVPLLWVYAQGAEDVGVVLSAAPDSEGTWAYYETQRGCYEYLYPCGDATAAAEQVDQVLQRRIIERIPPV